jgi:predicted nucleic acid-binding protein
MPAHERAYATFSGELVDLAADGERVRRPFGREGRRVRRVGPHRVGDLGALVEVRVQVRRTRPGGHGVAPGVGGVGRRPVSVDADRFDVVAVETTPLLSCLQENSNLSDADIAVLAYADAYDGVGMMDETYSRDVATAEGITTRGTAYLVLKLASEGTVSADAARTVIDAMIDEGWHCAPDVYAKIVQKLDSLAD